MPARKQSDGRWAMWLDLGRDDDGKRLRRRCEGKTKREAETKAAELRARHERGEDVLERPRTLGELLDDWIRIKEREGRAAGSLKAYRGAIKHLRPKLGAIPVPTLQRRIRDLQRHFDELGDTFAPSNVQLVKSCLVQALNLAVEQREISFNPAEHLRIAPVKRNVGRSMTDAERGKVLAACEAHRLGLAVRFGLLGLRKCEIAGLRWEDVDWAAGAITVRRQLAKVNGKWTGKGLKGDAPPRRVSFGAPTLAALRLHQRAQQLEREAMGWADAGWMFVSTRTGEVAPPSAIYVAFKAIAAAAGVPDYRLHDARHTAATSMLTSGEAIPNVAGALGHASPETTMRVYAHALPDQVADATRRLDEAMRPARPAEGEARHAI